VSRRSRSGEHDDPEPVGLALRQVTDQLGLTDPDAVLQIRDQWRAVVGDAVAAHATPASLRAGVLVVLVDAPQWATQIRYLASEIMRGLGDSDLELREVHVRVRSEPTKS
jgi:predicted nucleic acid-binding Zn ribbon protein